MNASALALPDLGDVPTSLVTSAPADFLHVFSKTLLAAGLVTGDIACANPSTDQELCARAMTRRWNQITQGLSLFDWRLSITENSPETFACYSRPIEKAERSIWMLIQTEHGPVSCPVIYIGTAIQRLELIRVGLGQTVLAALYEACHHYLPFVATPCQIEGMASMTYWSGEADETFWLQEEFEQSGCQSMEEFASEHDIFRRADFFANMPEWVANPRRVLTSRQVALAGRRDRQAAEVIAAVDSLCGVITHYGPFAKVGYEDAGPEPIDFALVIRWSLDDAMFRVLDDYLQWMGDGDALIAAAAVEIPLKAASIKTWCDRMCNTAMLAGAVENVLRLISVSQAEAETAAPKQAQIRVMA